MASLLPFLVDLEFLSLFALRLSPRPPPLPPDVVPRSPRPDLRVVPSLRPSPRLPSPFSPRFRPPPPPPLPRPPPPPPRPPPPARESFFSLLVLDGSSVEFSPFSLVSELAAIASTAIISSRPLLLSTPTFVLLAARLRSGAIAVLSVVEEISIFAIFDVRLSLLVSLEAIFFVSVTAAVVATNFVSSLGLAPPKIELCVVVDVVSSGLVRANSLSDGRCFGAAAASDAAGVLASSAPPLELAELLSARLITVVGVDLPPLPPLPPLKLLPLLERTPEYLPPMNCDPSILPPLLSLRSEYCRPPPPPPPPMLLFILPPPSLVSEVLLLPSRPPPLPLPPPPRPEEVRGVPVATSTLMFRPHS